MAYFKELLVLCTFVLICIGAATPMSCSYGPRGSLTVFCDGATSKYFRMSSYRFDHLDETLKCRNCDLEDLKEGTFDISSNQIRTLDISNSSIKTIYAKAFIGLIFAEKIILSDNPINTILPEAFWGVRKVRELEMIRTVHVLRTGVFRELSLLRVLNLRDSKLTVIETGTFEGLYNLKVLDLSNNSLENLNNIFSPLKNLEILLLSNNRFGKIINNEFIALKSLLQLNLDSNVLHTFTITMNQTNNLRVLNLAKNHLHESSFGPSTFSNLNVLEELHLGDNYISTIPPRFFFFFHHLTKLDLHGNFIKALKTGSFSGLPHLSELNLSSNILDEIVVTGNLEIKNLHTLDLAKNHITSIDYPSLVRRMRHLRFLNLEWNFLTCEAITNLGVELEGDGISFAMTSNGSACPDTHKSLEDVETEMVLEYVSHHSDSGFVTTMFVLVFIAILLLVALFYVQLFVLTAIGRDLIAIRIVRKNNTSVET